MKLSFSTDQGIGTRATLGVVVLETDETLEHEFATLLRGDGVALYHSRIPMVSQIRPDTLAKMEANIPASVRLLPPSLTYDVIGYGCTSAATIIGSDHVARAVHRIYPEAQVTDPLLAFIAACKSLNAKRIGFLTPYVAEVSERMRQKLDAAAITTSAFGSFEEGDDRIVARITPESIAAAAYQIAAQSQIDAILIACTNLRCLPIIPKLEAELGCPVISSNLALAWQMLRLAGLQDKKPELGHLFDRQI